MKRLVTDWTRFVLIVLPLGIVVFATAVLVVEWRQSDAEKAVRLVRESKSRKENFTVQQYLYATVYHRKARGEALTINGWHAEPETATGVFMVSFTYADANGKHVAVWQANPKEQRITSKNKEADEFSW